MKGVLTNVYDILSVMVAFGIQCKLTRSLLVRYNDLTMITEIMIESHSFITVYIKDAISIVKKLSKCFDAMGRNVNKPSRICGPDIFNKFIFVIFLHA